MELSLKDAVKDFLQANHLSDKINEVRLRILWKELLGIAISKHTTDLYFKKKILYVRFDSAPLKEELSYSKTNVMKGFNDAFGEELISEIVVL